jgi:DNA-binding transcriptional LysR family regulator
MVRTSSGIIPNHEGEMLLPVIRELLNTGESLEQHIAKIKGADTGRIRIAAYPSVATYWLPAIIRDFQKDYPQVEIQIIEMGSGAIQELMENRQADLCIYAGGENKDFEWMPLCEDRMLVLLSANNPLAELKGVPAAELEKEKFIIPIKEYDGEVYDILDTFSKRPETAFSACSDYAIVNMVRLGLGVSILPELLVKNYDNGAVAREMDPPRSRVLGMGVPQIKAVSPVTRNFMRYVEEFVKKNK